jgi:hypothetical protein
MEYLVVFDNGSHPSLHLNAKLPALRYPHRCIPVSASSPSMTSFARQPVGRLSFPTYRLTIIDATPSLIPLARAQVSTVSPFSRTRAWSSSRRGSWFSFI